VLTGCASAGGGGTGGTTYLEGARLILGDGRVIENGALLIEGEQIREVGPASAVRAPADAVVVDLTGMTVIPALIDAHAHLGYEGYTGWGADYYSRDNLIEHLERYAYYGFGAVFSAGTDPDDLALGLQRDQELRRIGGARFLFAAGMAPPGQGPNNQFLGHALAVASRADMTVLWGVSSPGDARRAVRQIAAEGIEYVKIWVDDRGGTQSKMHPLVYQAIADEARGRGVRVVVHQQSADDMPGLLEAGVSGFLHGRIGPELDETLARSIRRANAFVVPNLGLGELRWEPVSEDPFLQEAVSDAVVERLRSAYRERVSAGTPPPDPQRERELSEGFMRLVDGGVNVILGTDAGAVPDHFFGYTGHRELEIFVRLGMTPMQAIMAATSRPADLLGLDDMGTLSQGKSADFVILRDNPLDDIRNTRSIEDVYLRGVEQPRALLRRSWPAGS
jgi:imidazolonepropionase-like amidohydrolase